MTTANLFQTFRYDGRHALRQLLKTPGFASTAICILGLGIATNVAIFAFVDAALFAPLPYRDQDQLVSVFETTDTETRGAVSYLNYLDWRRLNTVFDSIEAYGGSEGWGFSFRTTEGTYHVTGLKVTGGFFRALGVKPIRGRDFEPGEDSPGMPASALLSYGAWHGRFGGRPDIVGQVATLSDVPHTIIGVLPREFHFAPAGSPEFWTLQRGSNPCEQNRACRSVFTIARLKTDGSRQSAISAMNGIARQLGEAYPDANRGRGVSVTPLREVFVGNVRPLFLVVSSGAALLLLIAFINVSALLLARSDHRKRELAVRAALGASPARIVRQFATEAFVLVALSTASGLVLARWLMTILGSLIPVETMTTMPYLRGLDFNGRVLTFAIAVAVVPVLLFALVPITRASLSNMREGLTEGSRGVVGKTWRNVSATLVTGELAIAVTLLVGASLLGQSLYRLLQVDVGFTPEGLATIEVDLPATYAKPEQVVPLKRQIIERVATMPGVQQVAIADQLPLSSWGGTTAAFEIVGRPSDGKLHEVSNRRVSANYFTTLGAHLVRGRDFTDADERSMHPVVIINETLAQRYFGDRNPLDQSIFFKDVPQRPMQIVGVVADVKDGALDAAGKPALYVPFEQSPNKPLALVVRTALDAETVLRSLAATLHRIDAGLALIRQQTMQERIGKLPSTYLYRTSAWLVGAYAAAAFLLCVIGVYGVVSYSVSQRTPELGVRLALGAQPAAIYGLVLKEAVWLAGIGTCLGAVGAIAAATMARHLLFGVEPWDVTTVAAVGMTVVCATLLASYIPARRAAAVDAITALRAE
jgi:macrolide transport system ATP-binding/permease protein